MYVYIYMIMENLWTYCILVGVTETVSTMKKTRPAANIGKMLKHNGDFAEAAWYISWNNGDTRGHNGIIMVYNGHSLEILLAGDVREIWRIFCEIWRGNRPKKTKAWLTVPYFDMGLAIFCRFDMVGPPNNPPKMAEYDMGCGENHLRNPIDMGFLLVKKTSEIWWFQ